MMIRNHLAATFLMSAVVQVDALDTSRVCLRIHSDNDASTLLLLLIPLLIQIHTESMPSFIVFNLNTVETDNQ